MDSKSHSLGILVVLSMQFFVENLTCLIADEVTPQEDGRYCFDKKELPKLDWVPAMQRRRLSAFTKMALHCAYQASAGDYSLPVIFSSRHGDLHKTSSLLDSLASRDSLSPTAFSMSVHNASAGLLSILTDNKSSSNTISAGRDSLFMAIVDAYARLMTSDEEKVLVVHCDQALPDAYLEFSDEIQVDHCVAFVMSKSSEQGIELAVDILPEQLAEQMNVTQKPLAIEFAEFCVEKCQSKTLNGASNQWLFKAVAA